VLANSATQALLPQHPNLDLNHVQQAGLLRQVMEVDPLKQQGALCDRKVSQSEVDFV